MAHELEIVNGQARMMYVGEMPWTGLGVGLQEPPTCKEAIRIAGLDWPVESVPTFARLVVNADGQASGIASGEHAIIRTTDGAVLGNVGPSYVPLQNSEAFDFFAPAVEAGYCALETAGSLRGGRIVWILARIKDTTAEVVSGDPVNPFFLLSNGHDGVRAVSVGFTGIRVVCQNTLTLAHHNDKSRLIKVRHTKNLKNGLDKIAEIIDWQRSTFAATVEQMRAMARFGVNTETLKAYVSEVFAPEISVRAHRKEDSAEKAVEKLLEKITPAFEGVGAAGQGNALPGVRGTMWGAYNAVTGYLTHERGRSADNRLNSLWFGQGANTNQRAFDVAMTMAA